MKFGVFDHMDSSGEPLRELFENRLRLAEAYDRAGIHALHVAEHHSTPLGMSPSPSVFLALGQKPHPPLWYGVFSPQSAEWAVRNGVNVVTNVPPGAVRAITDFYRGEWARLGNDPALIPLMGMNRHMVIADSDREAMETGRRAYRRWFENF